MLRSGRSDFKSDGWGCWYVGICCGVDEYEVGLESVGIDWYVG